MVRVILNIKYLWRCASANYSSLWTRSDDCLLSEISLNFEMRAATEDSPPRLCWIQRFWKRFLLCMEGFIVCKAEHLLGKKKKRSRMGNRGLGLATFREWKRELKRSLLCRNSLDFVKLEKRQAFIVWFNYRQSSVGLVSFQFPFLDLCLNFSQVRHIGLKAVHSKVPTPPAICHRNVCPFRRGEAFI